MLSPFYKTSGFFFVKEDCCCHDDYDVCCEYQKEKDGMFHTSAQNHTLSSFIDIFERDSLKPLKTKFLYYTCENFVRKKSKVTIFKRHVNNSLQCQG